MSTPIDQINAALTELAAIELPDDYRETMAILRERAEIARAELKSGRTLGPAMIRHITDGGGHPEMTLAVLDLLEKLVASLPNHQRAGESVKELSDKALAFVAKVEGFINERPSYINSINNVAPGNDPDYWRWNGHAEARRQLAELLNRTVPHNPGETTRSKARPTE